MATLGLGGVLTERRCHRGRSMCECHFISRIKNLNVSIGDRTSRNLGNRRFSDWGATCYSPQALLVTQLRVHLPSLHLFAHAASANFSRTCLTTSVLRAILTRTNNVCRWLSSAKAPCGMDEQELC